jgi:excisionase family DNA binding protein
MGDPLQRANAELRALILDMREAGHWREAKRGYDVLALIIEAQASNSGVTDFGSPAEKPDDVFVTTKQAAQFAGVQPQAIRKRVRAGKLAAVRQPGSREYRIALSDLEKTA